MRQRMSKIYRNRRRVIYLFFKYFIFFLVIFLKSRFDFSRTRSESKRRIIDSDGNEIYYAPESGTLTSPGFPNFFLPHLDCTWTLKIENERRLFVVSLTDLHLQEFNLVGTSSSSGDEVACTNSYVELGLGIHRKNGTYVKNRICTEDAVGVVSVFFYFIHFLLIFRNVFLFRILLQMAIKFTFVTSPVNTKEVYSETKVLLYRIEPSTTIISKTTRCLGRRLRRLLSF